MAPLPACKITLHGRRPNSGRSASADSFNVALIYQTFSQSGICAPPRSRTFHIAHNFYLCEKFKMKHSSFSNYKYICWGLFFVCVKEVKEWMEWIPILVHAGYISLHYIFQIEQSVCEKLYSIWLGIMFSSTKGLPCLRAIEESFSLLWNCNIVEIASGKGFLCLKINTVMNLGGKLSNGGRKDTNLSQSNTSINTYRDFEREIFWIWDKRLWFI